MMRSKHLAIACSALLMTAWSTQSIAEDTAKDSSEASRPQASPPSAATPGTTNPLPSTHRTEGTAADSTIPGATPTRNAEAGTANPMPATTRAEGTAADRTPPGETAVRGTGAAQAPEKVTSRVAKAEKAGSKPDQSGMTHALRGSSLIGLEVKDTQGSRVGSIEDIVVDSADGQITYAVVGLAASRGDPASFVVVPWSKFGTMMRDGQAVVERSQFASAPKITQSELQRIGQDSWRNAADQYWKRTKTAQADTTP